MATFAVGTAAAGTLVAAGITVVVAAGVVVVANTVRFNCPGASVLAGLLDWPGAAAADDPVDLPGVRADAEFPLPAWPGEPAPADAGAMPGIGPTGLRAVGLKAYAADDAHTATTAITFTYPI